MEAERTDPIGMDFTESAMHLDDLPSYESLARDTDMPESPFARTYPMEDFELPLSGLGHAKEPFEAPLEKPDGQSCDVIEPLTEETCDFSNIPETESGHAHDKQMEITAMEKPDEPEGDTKDKSGMSAYFETTTIKTDAAGSQGEGYYELSTTSEEQKDSLGNLPLPEISYSTLAQTHSLEVNPDLSKSTADTLKTTSPVDIRDDCRLSPGKLALDQRSYSLNITIGAMDHDIQGRPRNFSPLATDIMSHTSGSLDESADYLPATTPSVDKIPQFPPLILETTASVTPSSPPQETTVSDEDTSPQAESPESPVQGKGCYKNGTVMAPDLPEMLDLAGTRSRLASDNADPEVLRRKSVPMDMTSIVSDSLAHLLKGDPSQMSAKREMQLEEQGYCVFSEYSGPMPSPADVYSPMDASPQIFNTVISEEKELGFVAGEKECLLSEDVKTEEFFAPEAKAEDELQSKVDSFEKESTVADKPTTETKQDEADPLKAETLQEMSVTSPENEKEQFDKQAETFITPKVTVTLEEAKPDLDAIFATETEAEIADYERQIRKLEMEDRPLSVEEERELQELREKVKNKPDLVHQEAYEEVDAEDVYQLTGAAKDRIARPLRPSPASSVESATEEEKIHISDTEKPKSPEILKADPNRLSPVGSFEKYFREERPSEQEVKQKDAVESPKEKAVEEQSPPSPSKTEEKPSEQQKETIVEPLEEKPVEEQSHPSPLETAEAPVDTTATQEIEEEVEIAEEPEEIMPETKPAVEEKPATDKTEPAEIAVEKDVVDVVEIEQPEEEVLEGAKAAEDTVESRAAIESIVTVEDDFITVVQTIDEGEVSGHSVRFSAPAEEERPQLLEEEEEEESVEMAQEVEMEAASLEEVVDVPEQQVVPPVCPVKETEVQESEAPTQSYDDYKDETTIDDSILDSSWVDTQGAVFNHLSLLHETFQKYFQKLACLRFHETKASVN